MKQERKHIYLLSFFDKYAAIFSKRTALEILLGKNDEYFFKLYYGIMKGEKVSYVLKMLECLLKNGYLRFSEKGYLEITDKGKKVLRSKDKFLEAIG